MKKKMLLLLLVVLTASIWASAQYSNQAPADKSADTAKQVSVAGKISDDGKSFVSDKDGKSWTISNPEAVKGHEGHHVIVKAHVYADKGEIHVMSLKMAKDAMAAPK